MSENDEKLLRYWYRQGASLTTCNGPEPIPPPRPEPAPLTNAEALAVGRAVERLVNETSDLRIAREWGGSTVYFTVYDHDRYEGDDRDLGDGPTLAEALAKATAPPCE